MEKKKTFFLLLIFIVALFSFIINKSFARHQSMGATEVPVGVAVPIYGDSIQSINLPFSDMKPGVTNTYNFYVTNTEASSVSYVSLDYYIEIERSTNLPVTFSLIKNSTGNNVLTPSGISTTYTSPTYTMTHSVETIDNFALTIDWPTSSGYYKYANLVDYITIRIYATQKVS